MGDIVERFIRTMRHWYYVRVVVYAIERMWTRKHAPVEALFVVSTTIALVFVVGWPETAQDWLIAASPLIGIASLALLDGMFQIVRAPVLMDREVRSRLTELEPRKVINIEPYRQGHWIHLKVTNRGETDDFVAQIIDAQPSAEDDVPTVPFSLKWRQSDEEPRRISKDQSVLLDFAEFRLNRGFKGPNGFGIYYYYNLHSTTARVEIGAVLTHQGEKNQISEAVTDEQIERTASVLVEVRGAAHRAVGYAWVHLGFRLDKTPLATLSTLDTTDSPPQ